MLLNSHQVPASRSADPPASKPSAEMGSETAHPRASHWGELARADRIRRCCSRTSQWLDRWIPLILFARLGDQNPCLVSYSPEYGDNVNNEWRKVTVEKADDKRRIVHTIMIRLGRRTRQTLRLGSKFPQVRV